MSTSTTTQTQAPPISAQLPAAATAAAETKSAKQPEIPLAQILPSKTNPRKNFSGPAMDELVESIRVHGVLQAVLVRPHDFVAHVPRTLNPTPLEVGAKYELVAGERRYRAAQIAGLKTIPATVREVTDDQVLEMQIIENLQREGVTAIEEANGYRLLLERLAKEKPKATRTELVQTIAVKISKSVRFVWARMKLNELIPELQKDLADGVIEASHGDELVRLCAKDQKEFREMHLFHGGLWEGSEKRRVAHSVKEIKKTIKQQYQLELAKASFPIADAALVPAAGACGVCLKNSANNPTAEADPKKPVCMDRACFAAKQQAFVALEALAKVDGDKVKKAELLHVTTSHSPMNARYKDKDLPVMRKGWKTAKAGECQYVQPAVVVEMGSAHDEAVAAKLVCANTKCTVHFGEQAASSSTPKRKPDGPTKSLAEYQEEHKQGFVQAVDGRASREVFSRVIANVSKIGERELRMMAKVCAGSYLDRDVREVLFGEMKGQVGDVVAKMKAADLPRILVGLVFSEELGRGSWSPEFSALLKSTGIDEKVVAADVRSKLERCDICGCSEGDRCALGRNADYSTKYCGPVAKNTFGLKTLCSNALCKAEAERLSLYDRASKAGGAKADQQAFDVRKKSLQDLRIYVETLERVAGVKPAKRDLSPAELASISDKKSVKAPSSPKAAASPKRKTTKNAQKKVAKKSSAKKGGR